MAVETDAHSHKRALDGKQTEGDPLKELSGLAEGLEPNSATKEDLDDYEEVCFDMTGSSSLRRSFSCTLSMHYATPISAILLCEDGARSDKGVDHLCSECTVSFWRHEMYMA